MSEHDDGYASSQMPRTTGEFRAAPDISASTAEFKAFASNRGPEDELRGASGGAWPEQPWSGGPAKSGSGRTMVIMASVVVAVVVVIALVVAIG